MDAITNARVAHLLLVHRMVTVEVGDSLGLQRQPFVMENRTKPYKSCFSEIIITIY